MTGLEVVIVAMGMVPGSHHGRIGRSSSHECGGLSVT